MSENNTVKQDFVHLHCHTHISVQDALPSPKQLVMYARELGFPAIAITDHGRMGGVIEFVEACRKPVDGLPTIKPIIGQEFYTYHDMYDKNSVIREDGITKGRPKHPHLILLAMNENGYKNIMKASSIGASEGYYYEATIDWSVLEKYSEDVICLSGCMGGEISRALLAGNDEEAEEIAKKFQGLFGDRYYIELQFHRIKQQKEILPKLKALADKLGIKCVASNDVHYLKGEDWAVHDVLIQMRDMAANKKKDNGGKKQAYLTHEFYLKTEAEMRKIFDSFCPDAIKNSIEIAERVEDFLKLDVPHLLPSTNIPDNQNFLDWWHKVLPYNQKNEAYLAYLSFKGLQQFGFHQSKTYVNRLKYELKTIWYMGVTDYFLIQHEMVEFMRENGIMYGIRGSGVGSLVNYCIHISQDDPIRFDLMFERFLNPGRGTQYSINYSCYPSKKWIEDNGKQDQTEAVAKIQSIIDQKKEEDEFKPFVPAMEKELWVLENQNLASYITDLSDKGFKSEKNEAQLWSAYFLGITSEQPTGDLIIYKVATLPDVDTDIDDSRRGEVIEWAKNRFGIDHVASIGTRGTYQCRAAVTNSLKVSERFCQKWGDAVAQKATEISQTIPTRTNPPMTIAEAKEQSPDFNAWAKVYTEEINIAEEIIGKISHMGVHAAGLLVSSEPISSSAPIENAKGVLYSAYDMQAVERVGLVKYDYLGLATYQMLSKALKMIKERHGETIDLNAISLDDPNVFKLYSDGKTSSLFQCASSGMQSSLKEVGVDCINDLIAIIALYRPGPLDFIPDYAAGKRNPAGVKYADPVIEQKLADTYGIMVYQEQAMFLAREMGGLDWIEVDKLRKGISKKIGQQFEDSCNLLKSRALAKGYKPEVIKEVLRLMEKFGGYAFNKSHSCSYALLSYRTAYLRTYYPAEWLAVCMHVDRDDEIKMAQYKKEARIAGIKVIPANVNNSGFETNVVDIISNGESKPAITLPLISIKGVGILAETIVVNQPFEDVKDFVKRAKPNRGMVSSLLDGGALKCFPELNRFGEDKEEIMCYYDSLVEQRKKDDKIAEKEKKQGYKILSPMMMKKQQAAAIEEKENKRKPTIKPFDMGVSDSLSK